MLHLLVSISVSPEFPLTSLFSFFHKFLSNMEIHTVLLNKLNLINHLLRKTGRGFLQAIKMGRDLNVSCNVESSAFKTTPMQITCINSFLLQNHSWKKEQSTDFIFWKNSSHIKFGLCNPCIFTVYTAVPFLLKNYLSYSIMRCTFTSISYRFL